MTESAGGVTRRVGPEEAQQYGSLGRLAENMEAKIIDPESGESLPPGQRGELWLRGPAIMKGDKSMVLIVPQVFASHNSCAHITS